MTATRRGRHGRRLKNRNDLQETTMTQTQPMTVTSPESLDHMWAGFVAAQREADEAGDAAEREERAADAIGQDIAQLREQVKAKEAEAAAALRQSAEYRRQQTRKGDIAADLRRVVDELAPASNLQHPQNRSAHTLPPKVTALDGPLPPMGPPPGSTPVGGTPMPGEAPAGPLNGARP